MRTIIMLITFIFLSFGGKLFAQGSYQTFASQGFKVKCECSLYENSVFIQAAKQQGIKNILAAYICAENKDYKREFQVVRQKSNFIQRSHIWWNILFYEIFSGSLWCSLSEILDLHRRRELNIVQYRRQAGGWGCCIFIKISSGKQKGFGGSGNRCSILPESIITLLLQYISSKWLITSTTY